MSRPRMRALAGILGVALAGLTAVGVGGCGLFHDTPPIEKAASYLPADATAVIFSDRERVAKRLDVDGISGRDATAQDVRTYLRAWADVGWDGTHLAPYLPAMRTGPFNELDVEWEAAASWGDHRSALVWRADSDLDLGALGRSLTEHGYTKDIVDGLARYSIDFAKRAAPDTQLVGGLYPALMTDVLLDSDDHLVVGSQSPEALADVAAVVSGDADSLADHPGDYDELLGKAHEAEYAAMADGPDICPEVTPYGADRPAAPEPTYTALGHPVARALVATADPLTMTNYLEFASTADASADAAARTTLIRSGKEERQDLPFRTLGDFTVHQDGDLVSITSDWAEGPKDAVSAELTGGGPAACLPRR